MGMHLHCEIAEINDTQVQVLNKEILNICKNLNDEQFYNDMSQIMNAHSICFMQLQKSFVFSPDTYVSTAILRYAGLLGAKETLETLKWFYSYCTYQQNESQVISWMNGDNKKNDPKIQHMLNALAKYSFTIKYIESNQEYVNEKCRIVNRIQMYAIEKVLFEYKEAITNYKPLDLLDSAIGKLYRSLKRCLYNNSLNQYFYNYDYFISHEEIEKIALKPWCELNMLKRCGISCEHYFGIIDIFAIYYTFLLESVMVRQQRKINSINETCLSNESIESKIQLGIYKNVEEFIADLKKTAKEEFLDVIGLSRHFCQYPNYEKLRFLHYTQNLGAEWEKICFQLAEKKYGDVVFQPILPNRRRADIAIRPTRTKCNDILFAQTIIECKLGYGKITFDSTGMLLSKERQYYSDYCNHIEYWSMDSCEGMEKSSNDSFVSFASHKELLNRFEIDKNLVTQINNLAAIYNNIEYHYLQHLTYKYYLHDEYEWLKALLDYTKECLRHTKLSTSSSLVNIPNLEI